MSLLIRALLIVLLLALARDPPAHADGAAMTCAVEGANNPAVTQQTIKQTVCVPGWTKTVRPQVKYTDALKRKLLARGKRAGEIQARAKLGDFELDHCIPLELGGHPRSPKNLWLQPWKGKCGAHAKDKQENQLHRQLCSGETTLPAARKAVKHWC